MSGRGDAVAALARERFGWERLRAGQSEPVEALAAGHDVLAVLPTGAGKSAVYQLAGLLRGGLTVVVSPLLSLQADQIDSLRGRGLHAVRLSSAETAAERRRAEQDVARGEAQFVLVSPEQLAVPAVLDLLAAARPTLVAVDEAHCVTSWGHDFRPDYLRIGEAVQRLGAPPVAALTATASPPVREDITERLGLRDPLVVVRGLDRPAIRLEVLRVSGRAEQEDAVLLRAAAEVKPEIVYCATRRAAEDVAARLTELGLHARCYHAGLSARERARAQADFLEGRVPVITATTAFGMGIDKPDVRTVLHAAVPASPDAYLQELGRAGRDGEPALALLVYNPADLGLARYFASGLPAAADLHRLATLLAAVEGQPVARRELTDATGWGSRRVGVLLNLLVEAGAALPGRRGRTSWRVGRDPGEAAARALRVAERDRAVVRSRVDMMRGYAETPGCRRQYLLAYFGEQLADPCGRCDRCDSGEAVDLTAEDEDSPFRVASRVHHADWGDGTVMGVEEDRVVVLFEEVGYKVLATDAVQRHDLLRAAD